MKYWLVKSEPDAYSWSRFVSEKKATWDGVRNYQARNNLSAMEVGDPVLFYHSVKNQAVVGLAKVVRDAYPDPTVPDDPRWVVVELVPVMAFDNPVTLARLKSEPLLQNMALLRQSRLSVMPVRPDEFELILALAHAPVA
ncbi:EVE domain-containing protein [Nibrella viscosa]|uniref:EVE domain-containing protein n=1 Tax=Nibrella viscosa TaxID=1084524 RepID=A0ABP8L3Q6_9BACT